MTASALLATLRRANAQADAELPDATLAQIDALAREVMLLEAAVVAQLTYRERAIDKEAALVRAARVKALRESSPAS